jgi:hypothetical protein
MKSVVRFLMASLLAAATTVALAAPVGYSVNSDADQLLDNGDSLHRIDLETGVATAVSGEIVVSATGYRTDIEGLAFDLSGNLWAIDEDSFRLFQVSTVSGFVKGEGDVSLSGLSDRSENDFGMTFTCDDQLYISSVTSQTLYRLGLDGVATVVGATGALDYNISALAAWGNPVELYGLGNGLDGNNVPDARSLFLIDTQTGKATQIGTLGPAASNYFQAGLSFDTDGTLWALTDRGDQPSEVLNIDVISGEATLISTVSGGGFESLAVAAPSGCDDPVIDDEPVFLPFENNAIAVPTTDGIGKLIFLVLLLGTGLLALNRHPR